MMMYTTHRWRSCAGCWSTQQQSWWWKSERCEGKGSKLHFASLLLVVERMVSLPRAASSHTPTAKARLSLRMNLSGEEGDDGDHQGQHMRSRLMMMWFDLPACLFIMMNRNRNTTNNLLCIFVKIWKGKGAVLKGSKRDGNRRVASSAWKYLRGSLQGLGIHIRHCRERRGVRHGSSITQVCSQGELGYHQTWIDRYWCVMMYLHCLLHAHRRLGWPCYQV